MKPGEVLRLNLQLFDGATDKYVRAFVLNDAGAEISGSPVTLPHQAHGLYASNALVMPISPQVKAVYRVYDDALFTVQSIFHSDAIDVFTLTVKDCAEHLIGTIERDSLLSGVVDQTNLTGQAFTETTLNGIVDVGNVLVGKIEVMTTLTGQVNDGDLTGSIDCCDEV